MTNTIKATSANAWTLHEAYYMRDSIEFERLLSEKFPGIERLRVHFMPVVGAYWGDNPNHKFSLTGIMHLTQEQCDNLQGLLCDMFCLEYGGYYPNTDASWSMTFTGGRGDVLIHWAWRIYNNMRYDIMRGTHLETLYTEYVPSHIRTEICGKYRYVISEIKHFIYTYKLRADAYPHLD